MMRTRKLGNSDLNITPVGFGAWAIGGAGYDFGWGSQDDADSVGAIHRALDLGVNWIDTAAVYGIGRSEEVVGRALKTWKGSRPYLFTKCAMRWDSQGRVTKVHKRDSLLKECDDSLRRLQVDVIDLYQIHWPPEDNGPDVEESWQAMDDLKKLGKVRWIGVSNYSVEQMKRLERIAPVTSDQPPYSLLRRKIESDVLPYCEQSNIGTIIYSPMLSGLLTGAMTKERAENLPADDWRTRNPEFREPKLSNNLELVERMRAVGKRRNRTPGEVAIAWTLRLPAVTGAIVGARNAKQAEGVMSAGEFALSRQDIAEIEGAVAIAQAAR
jgi:aryl-alcohol dehydrogenase-like predicted oxidoreductase